VSYYQAISWRRVMSARDPDEPHRASTPLELLFDLCFVVAVSQAAAQYHHALAQGHAGTGVLGYLMVFFAIWWAWMNFTWFASAYDTDDIPYRLLTLLQMAGVLVLAAGAASALADYDFTVITVGYVLMRVAMVGQWLRAAVEHPAGRAVALRYATGIAVAQVGWTVRLALPHPLDYVGFVVLAVTEIAVPIWAEHRRSPISWHPGHIVERYGLFTLIVLGEAILGSFTGIQSALSEHGLSVPVLLIAVGGLVLVFALWWTYFTGVDSKLSSTWIAMTWGYGHYLVFAATAAVGAGLDVAVDAAAHADRVPPGPAALAVTLPVALFVPALAFLHRMTDTGAVGHPLLVAGGTVVVFGLGFTTGWWGIGGTVLAVGLATGALLAANLMVTGRRARAHAAIQMP